MKNIRRIIIALAVMPLFATACLDLDYNEITNHDEEWVYDSPIYGVEKLLTNLYAHLDYDFGKFNGAMYSSATDESEFALSLSDIHKFYNGAWSPIVPFDHYWTNAYSAIAEANRFMEKLDKINLEDYKNNTSSHGDLSYDALKSKFELFPYEARFLRAYFYFELVRAYGDVPLITKPLTQEEANKVSRTDADEVFRFIVSECDAIAEFLPLTYSTEFSQQTGRITRLTVLALKARTLLYHASPLFNKTGDKERWADAAKASKQVIDCADLWGCTLDEYAKLWGDNNFKSPEMIFIRPTGTNRSFEQNNFPVGVENGKSGNCPTQSLVDAYEYKATGEAFGEKWSAEVINVSKDKPYDGLDPRFGLTIAKNGDTWPVYNDKPLETFAGGLNGSPVYGATPTGYYLKKYCDNTVIISTNNAVSKRHSWIIFRLAEFYLNFAEAAFEYLGDADAQGDFGMSANEAVNVLRNRSDIKMPEFSGSEGFTERYRRERMVELAFEGARFWDVRRWKAGDKHFKEIGAAEFTKNSDGDIILNRKTVRRNWDEKFYLFPIPFTERQINENLEQNPGWGN